MKSKTVEKFSLLIVAVLLIAGGVRFWRNSAPSPAPAPEIKALGNVGNFTLTERSGKTVSRADLLGKIWVADFIFTRCAGICPMMSGKMRGLKEKLGPHEDLRFVSFSVDPDYDSPEVLSKYAERYGAGNEWLFLTGDKKTIHGLSSQHFHLAVGEIPEAERVQDEQSINHSSRFVLIDKEGRIRGYYNTENDDAAMERLAADAKQLLA